MLLFPVLVLLTNDPQILHLLLVNLLRVLRVILVKLLLVDSEAVMGHIQKLKCRQIDPDLRNTDDTDLLRIVSHRFTWLLFPDKILQLMRLEFLSKALLSPSSDCHTVLIQISLKSYCIFSIVSCSQDLLHEARSQLLVLEYNASHEEVLDVKLHGFLASCNEHGHDILGFLDVKPTLEVDKLFYVLAKAPHFLHITF